MADIDYEIIIDNPTQFLIQLNEQGPAGPAGRDGEQGEPGIGINSIVKSRSEGLVDVYVITYSNGATQEFRVTNGSGISSIEKTASEGLVDTYTIYYTNGENTFFTVTNGQNAVISGASATVDATVGTPSVDVVTGGTQFDRNFQFNFHNLKGEKGDKGDAGGAEWGNVNGDISDQQDLMNLLGEKQDTLSPIEPIYIGQDVLYPAIEPTSSASSYEYRAVKSIPVTAKNATLEDGAEFNHLNSIPFEFDKVYKLPTGSADNIYGYDVLGISYKFGKYNSTLDKVVPIASFGKMTTQVYRLPSDSDGDVTINSSALVSTSNTAIGDISGVSSSNMYVQKVNTSTGIKLYMYGKYNYISSSGGLIVDTLATVISDANGSTAFTDLMKECTLLTECNQNSNHNSYQSVPYYEIEGTLDTITDTSELGEAKYFPTTREAEYGEYGLGVRYDGDKIILDSNNKLTVNESALNLSSEISTINSKISSTATSSNRLQSLTDVQQAIVDGTESLVSNDLDDLSDEGEARLHALKAYSDNGEVLTDTKGLVDVTNYAHSTFDLSKFTVVGSPTITDDGIASEFSISNYVRANGITLGSLQNKSFEIKIKFKVGEKSQRIWYPSNIDWGGTRFAVEYHAETSYKEFRFYFQFGSSDSPAADAYQLVRDGVNGSNINVGDIYELKYKFDYPNNLTFSICKEGTNNIISQKVSPAEGFTNVGLYAINHYPNGLLSLYCTNDNTKPQDLKQFSITVDGVEVFSGNKTGLDVIKPDDYTVVGTPIISADGIASGFSNSNYLTFPNLNLENADTWEIEGIVNTVSNLSRSDGTWLSPRTGNGIMLPCAYNNIGADIRYQLYLSSTNSSWDIADDNSITFPSGHTVKCNLKFTGTQYIYTCTDLDTNVVKNKIIDSTVKVYQSPTQIGLKRNTSGLTGSIDLNAFKIYVDGDLVYQPCLKIPYTESKTGSKIVNATYRDRVNDMAGQFGYANYYTLDEDNGNFTLPQVELYGLIEKAASTVPSGVVQSSTINNIVSLTQAEYDALVTKDANTFYVIIPST